jgi:hypothetical protein
MVNFLYSSIKPHRLTPLSLTTREVKLSAKTYNFRDVVPRHLENQDQHPFWDVHFITHSN